jgi:hypothetical protein
MENTPPLASPRNARTVMDMSTGHTHRLPSVEKGREPDLTAEGTTREDVAHPGRDFFWGVATSGYQSEGGYNGPGEPLNNWAWAEQDGDVVPSGRTSDFWTLSHEDFGRCREMGLNAFRLSIEWSRIQPATVLGSKAGLDPLAAPPPFDERALYSTPSGSPIAARTGWSRSSPCTTLSIPPGWDSTRGSSPKRSTIS